MTIARREFVSGMTAAGAAGLLGLRPKSADAEPPLETTTIRLSHSPIACFAPIFVAEPLLHAEGFSRVEYVPTAAPLPPIDMRHARLNMILNSGEADLSVNDSPGHLLSLEAGGSFVLLAGLHAGCQKLLASIPARISSGSMQRRRTR